MERTSSFIMWLLYPDYVKSSWYELHLRMTCRALTLHRSDLDWHQQDKLIHGRTLKLSLYFVLCFPIKAGSCSIVPQGAVSS